MLKKQWLVAMVFLAAICSLLTYGCKSDSPTGPGTGGGGIGTKISAGVYTLTLKEWECGSMDTLRIVEDAILCSDFSFDELFELECPVTINNDSFTMDCTSTVTDDFCSYTERVQGSGTKVGETWTVTAAITISNEIPPDCSGDPVCSNVMVMVERTSGPPTACTYAGANTVEAAVVGGPLAGNTVFETSGFGSGVGGMFSWNFFGNAGTGFVALQQQVASTLNQANINVNLSDIDINSLPVTIDVSVVGGGVSTSALAAGTVNYFDQTTAGAYFFSTGGSGTITVNEVSDTHIAGTINSLSIDGQETPEGGGTPMSATRSLSGGFHVREDAEPTASKLPSRTGWIGRMLSK